MLVVSLSFFSRITIRHLYLFDTDTWRIGLSLPVRSALKLPCTGELTLNSDSSEERPHLRGVVHKSSAHDTYVIDLSVDCGTLAPRHR